MFKQSEKKSSAPQSLLTASSAAGVGQTAFPRRTGRRATWYGWLVLGVAVSLLGLTTVKAGPNAIPPVSVNFDATGDLTNFFNDGYATPTWSQSPTAGLAGGGGITIVSGTNDLHICKQGFPLQIGAVYIVSGYYYNVYNDGYGGLGFTSLTNGTLAGGGYATPLSAIGVSFHGGGGLMDNNSATAASTTFENWDNTLEIGSSSWFYFEVTLTCTGSNTFSQTIVIRQSDANGVLGALFTTTTVTGQVNTTLGGASVIYPFMSAAQERFVAMDNFTASTTASGVAPSVTLSPGNQTVAVGGTVNLTVTAAGMGPFSYQWLKDGGLVLGATNRTLTLANAGVTNSGVYYAVVTNVYGMNLSLPATVTVGTPQLLAWGNNQYGQLGDGTTSNTNLPEVVATNVITAAAGEEHTLFVKGDNTLWSVGFNGDGELGDGTQASRHTPESVATNVVAVAAGSWHSLFLQGDGTLWAVGQNYLGQLGNGTLSSTNTAFVTASNVVAVAAGYDQSYYLQRNGTLWAMGRNDSGQLGNGTFNNQRFAVPVASNVVAIAGGYTHALYLQRDGTLWAMGNNHYGQLGNSNMSNQNMAVTVASNVVAMAAGGYHSLYLKNDGTLWGMGENDYGELGDGTGMNQSLAVFVTNNVKAVTAGMYHSLFLKNDGTVWGMGGNFDGQLGDGTIADRSRPVAMAGLSLASVVSGNPANHTLAVGFRLPPTITSQPTNQTVVAGSAVAFTVAATGPALITYQWQFNGTNLAAATNDSYAIASAALTNAGNYTVEVACSGETVASATATLTVNLAVTVFAAPANAGSVTGGGDYGAGSLVPLTAIASNNWQFISWSDGTTNSSYTFQVPETNITLTAQFAPTVLVAGLAAPTNAGYVTGGGTYIVGSNAVLVAAASNSWQFISWSDGTTNSSYTFQVPETNITLTAQFAPTVLVAGLAAPTNAGYVAGGGTYFVGSNAVLVATASNSWQFISWSDGTTNPTNTFQVPETNIALTAQFTPTVVVTGLAAPTNAGYVIGGGTYIVGSNAVLVATASNSWQFISWSDGTTNPTNTFQVPATNVTLTAQYTPTVVVTGLAAPTNAGYVTGGGDYVVGSNAVLTATASNDWLFISWSDGTTNPTNTFLVPETNITLTAQFAPTVLVTGLAAPTNAGYVTGGGDYIVGNNVVLTATASNNWQFIRWSDGFTSSSYTFQAPATNLTLTAQFAPTVVVTGMVDPVNAGEVTGGGAYVVGSNAVLTATASNSWQFIRWSDGSTNPTNIFPVPDTNVTLTAQFVPTVVVTGWVDPTNAGYVAGGGTYIVGSNAVLTATASNDWQFISWSDGATNNPYTIQVPETNVTLTAQFGGTAIITVTVHNNQGGSVTGGGTFLVGSTNPISASAADNSWTFAQWNDGSTNNPYLIVVTTNRTYSAEFVPAALVTTVANPAAGGSISGGGVHALNSSIALQAYPANNWKFLNWNGTITNYTTTGHQANPWTGITVTQDVTYQANFGQVTNGFVYHLLDQYDPPQVEIIGYEGPTNKKVIIPTTIDGYKVTSIATGAFLNNGVTNLSVSSNVVHIASSGIGVGILEFVGIAAGFAFAADAFKDVLEADMVDMAADVAADLMDDLAKDVADLKVLTLVAEPDNGGHCEYSGVHEMGVPVIIKARPADGWKFVHWKDAEGAVVGSEETHTIDSLDTDATYTGVFAQETVDLVTQVEPAEATDCKVSGGGKYAVNESVTLTAEPGEGWRFQKWDDDSTDPVRTFNAPNEAPATPYTATFMQQVAVTTVADPEDAGTVTFDEPLDGVSPFDKGTEITLSAHPNDGWRFGHWNDGSTNSTLVFTAETASTNIATFVQQVKVTTVTEPEAGGAVTGGGTYDLGAEVTLNAVTNAGWRFAHWNDDSTNSTLTFTATASSTNTATFVRQVTVGAVADPEEGGTVTGGGAYDLGAEVTLTAVTNAGWRFAHWNDNSTNSTLTFTATADSTNTATFVQQVTITTVADPETGGTVTGGGTVDLGAEVTLTAVTNVGWRFAHWNDNSTNSTLTFTATANSTNTATFIQQVAITTVADPEAGGTVTGGGTYDLGAEVTLTAVTNAGWRFAHWSDNSTNSTLTFTATANSTNTATFIQQVAITTVADPGTGGTVTGGGTYDLGAEVTLNAVTNAGWRFAHWNDNSTNSALTFTTTADATNTATFVQQVTVTGAADPQEGGTVTGGGTYDLGAEVTLNAVTNAGWRFAHWNDNSTNSSLTFTATGSSTNTATFVRLVTVAGVADPEEGGTVTGGGTYDLGAEVTLNAVTNNGWRFVHWKESGATNNPLTLTASADSTNTAVFSQKVTVGAVADPEEGGSVTGAGTYDLGATVTLVATNNSDWRFVKWEENGSTNNVLTFTADTDVTNTAKFVEEVEVEGEAEPLYGGLVIGSGTYDAGSLVTLVAVPLPGFKFTGWFLDGLLTNEPVFFTVAEPSLEIVRYKAHFVRAVTVTVTANPTNAGSVTGGGLCEVGDTNTSLTATASNNWQFVSWNDGATNNPYVITVPDTNITYTANFAAMTSVTVDATGNPCGYLDAVGWTARVTPTNATGTVQFLTNGVAFDLETLTNGVATSLALSGLPRGTNWITVLYSGDATNLACTNGLAQVVTNHPPQAAAAYYLLPDVTDHKILISELATNWSDVDGDVIALASINASTNGVVVSMSAKYIYYSNTNRVNDQFTYVISDGQGGTALGLVNLLRLPERTNAVFNITSLVRNGDGSVTVGCVGIPGYVYWMEAATNLPHPLWEVVSTNTAGPNGQWSWTDTNAANYTLRFYRTYKP